MRGGIWERMEREMRRESATSVSINSQAWGIMRQGAVGEIGEGAGGRGAFREGAPRWERMEQARICPAPHLA